MFYKSGNSFLFFLLLFPSSWFYIAVLIQSYLQYQDAFCCLYLILMSLCNMVTRLLNWHGFKSINAPLHKNTTFFLWFSLVSGVFLPLFWFLYWDMYKWNLLFFFRINRHNMMLSTDTTCKYFLFFFESFFFLFSLKVFLSFFLWKCFLSFCLFCFFYSFYTSTNKWEAFFVLFSYFLVLVLFIYFLLVFIYFHSFFNSNTHNIAML